MLRQFLEAFERMAHRLEDFSNHLFTGIVKFLENARDWVVDVTTRIKDYLIRLGRAVARLVSALAKLALFYAPGVLLLLASLLYKSVWLTVFGLIWLVAVTAIGLTYGKEQEP